MSDFPMIDDSMPMTQRIATMQKLSTATPRGTDYILAVSAMESGVRWRIPDQAGVIAKGCSRIIVGLEGRGGVRASAWADPIIKNFLLVEGYTGSGMSETGTRAWSQKLLKDKPGGPVVAALFESAVKYRFRQLLPHFSLGPTQQLLLFTGKELGGGNALPAWPKTWQELWNMYLHETPTALMIRATKYLGQGPPNDSDESVIKWLQTHQTGGKDTSLAEQYYYGQGMWAGSPGVRGYLAQVRSIRLKG